MKMRSRLTALVLAVLMLISTAAPALAADALPLSVYQSMVDSAADQATSQPVIDEGGTLTDAATYIPQQKDLPVYESTTVQELSVLPAGSETAVMVALPQKGKVQLSVGTDGGQWQAQMLGQWINVSGENGAVCDVTYAKIKSLLDLNGEARFRWLSADGQSVSEMAVFTLTASTQTVVEDEPAAASNEVAVASEQVVMRSSSPMMKAMSARSTETDDNYTFLINYVFENNTIAADPYSASLAAGSSFNATVKFPVIMGYLPYINDVEQTEESYAVNITNIQANITVNVVYKPTLVDYTVIHYKQNVDNDGYAISETETKSGLTNSVVPAVEKDYKDGNNQNYDPDYAGFYSLLYQTDKIAADGSTVIEVRYDRYYYLINFDLDGGYGTEPIYARYGAPVEAETPTKAGYTFQGWSLDGTTAVALPETVPAQNVTYKALWKMNDTAQVKVVFWGENADDEDYSYLTTGVVDVKPGTEYTFVDGNSVFLICGKEEHTHTAECNLKCGKTEHITHTSACIDCSHTECDLSCYNAGYYYTLVKTEKPSQELTLTKNNIYTYTTTEESYWGGSYTQDHYYLFLDGEWYVAKSNYGGVQDTQQINYSCSHQHTEECYTCEYHEHVTACYSCGKDEHSHDSSCNQYGSGLDNTKWTFVRSETVTVAADGSTVVNVYYDRTTFTLTFKNDSRTEKTITDKWGADIHSEFPIKNSSGETMLWSVPDNCVSFEEGTYLASINVMPAENITFTLYDEVNAATIYYCVEVLPNESYAYTNTYNGVTKYFSLYKEVKYTKSGYLTYAEEFHDILGFKQWNSDPTFSSYDKNGKTSKINTNNYLYYARNAFDIVYYNPTDLLKTDDNVPYQMPLTNYYWEPTMAQAPEKYEPGSVKFDGWYLNPECTGEKFDFTTQKMPAEAENTNGAVALSLYAKWVPVSHTVNFYLDKTALDANTKLPKETHPELVVVHGNKVENVPATPVNGAYTFVGWFYIDEESGEEKAFDFANMPITKDMQVYGKWSSNVLKSYFVYFKIQGTDTQIADPITGSDLAGTTKTFDAKGEEELYEGYQVGYFPVVKSHSMTLDIENDAKNTFTFWYVQKDAVPYTVYYVTENQNEAGTLQAITLEGKTYYIVADTYTNTQNRHAVVTEKFKTVQGYMPDAYQKRLIVDGTEGAENILIFIYTPDTEHAYYKITHYTQNTDLESWTEYNSSEAEGDIGTTYTADPLTIPGFTYDPSVAGTLVSGVLTANGMELKLYYVRNPYPYEVRYLEKDTGNELHAPKTSTGKYGQVISEEAIPIGGYTAIDPTAQTLNIRIEESETELKLNIITFYYVENEVKIKYQVVGPEGCGTVDLNDGEMTPPARSTEEAVKMYSGRAMGASAEASELYDFVGWYTNEACTVPVTAKDGEVVGTSFVPAKEAETEATKAAYEEATFYAKFVEKQVNINYVAVGPEGCDANGTPLQTVAGSVAPPSETVNVLTGAPAGSTATASSNVYKFVGWYSDAACTEANRLSTDAKYVPTKAAEAAWVNGTTYYAKFDYNVATLTIKKTGMNDYETAVFLVTAVTEDSTEAKTFYVSVPNGKSVTIDKVVIGTDYSVVEQGDWTWRYSSTATNASGTIAATGSVAEFTNKQNEFKWLDHENLEHNVFGTPNNQ